MYVHANEIFVQAPAELYKKLNDKVYVNGAEG